MKKTSSKIRFVALFCAFSLMAGFNFALFAEEETAQAEAQNQEEGQTEQDELEKFIQYLMKDFNETEQPPSDVKSFTEDEYVDLVIKNNPDVEIALKNAYEAKMRMYEALSESLPAGSVSGGYERNIMKTTLSPWDNELNVNAAVTWDIYNPKAIGDLIVAKKSSTLAMVEKDDAIESLKNEARQIYAYAQYLKAVTQVREKVSKNFESISKSQFNKFRAGSIKELDFRLAQVDWNNSLFDVSKARKAELISLNALKLLAKIPMEEKIHISFFYPKTKKPEFHENKTFEQILADRYDYKKLLIQKEIAEQKKINSYCMYIPSVSGGFAYEHGLYSGNSSLPAAPSSMDGMSVGLKVNLPVLQGGYRVFLNLELESANKKAQLVLDKKQMEIKKDIEDSVLSLYEAWDRIVNAYEMIEVAERAAQLARSSVLNGVETQVVVSQAETKLMQCKLNMQESLYDFRAYYYDYLYYIGEYNYRSE